jgi:hypothetical protein
MNNNARDIKIYGFMKKLLNYHLISIVYSFIKGNSDRKKKLAVFEL